MWGDRKEQQVNILERSLVEDTFLQTIPSVLRYMGLYLSSKQGIKVKFKVKMETE